MIKKLTIMMILITFSLSTYARKDITAWKQETTLKKQFSVFKQNLTVWQDYMSFKEPQIDALFSAVNDTINILETRITKDAKTLLELNSTITKLNYSLTDTQSKLDESLAREDSFSTLGMQVSKESFGTIMYTFSALLLILSGVLFFLFNKSNSVTSDTKDKYSDLDDEFEEYKKNNLERVTKLNRELHDCRMKSGTL